jgi:hypothetical protein
VGPRYGTNLTIGGHLLGLAHDEPVSKRTGSNGRIRVGCKQSFQLSNVKQHESAGRLAQSAERRAKSLEVVGSNLGFLHFLTLLSRKETRIRYRVRVILITLR